MTTELFLDLLLSFAVLYVYHSDLHASRPAYACGGNDLIFGSHQEYAPVTCLPDDPEWLAESVYAPQPAEWIIDPTEAVVSVETQSETDDLSLAQMFALADSMVPMEPEVAAELTSLLAEINDLCPEGSGAGPVLDMLTAFATPAVSTETKSATVPQLKTLALSLGLKPAAKKADLNEQVLNTFADRGIDSYEIGTIITGGVLTFVPSADDMEMNVVV